MRKGFGKGGGREGMLFKKILSFIVIWSYETTGT